MICVLFTPACCSSMHKTCYCFTLSCFILQPVLFDLPGCRLAAWWWWLTDRPGQAGSVSVWLSERREYNEGVSPTGLQFGAALTASHSVAVEPAHSAHGCGQRKIKTWKSLSWWRDCWRMCICYSNGILDIITFFSELAFRASSYASKLRETVSQSIPWAWFGLNTAWP